MTELVSMTDISVSFAKRKVLDGISLSLKQGEITTIIGPNGAGKSTLIKVLLGFVKHQSGEIKKAADLNIGYVPQKLRLNDSLPLDVDRFLRLAGKFSSQERIDALKLVGAEHLVNYNMHALSGGETQRVLLARALLRRPALLVLDEPAQGVDTQGQVDLYNLIESIRHRFNCAVLMISHDLHLVMAKTDKVICLQHHICCTGTPEAIVSEPSYNALFGETTNRPLAFFRHGHHHHHDLAGQPVEGDISSCTNHTHGHHHD
jgi:zinc transport system ATP-binding protein